jgi:hypothetical protein
MSSGSTSLVKEAEAILQIAKLLEGLSRCGALRVLVAVGLFSRNYDFTSSILQTIIDEEELGSTDLKIDSEEGDKH